MCDPNSLPISPTPITHYTTSICDALFHQFDARQGKKKIGLFEVEQVIGQNQLYTTLLARHTLIDTRRRFTLKMYSFNVYTRPETRKKHEQWMLRDVNTLLWMESNPNLVQTFLPFPWEHNKYVLPVAWVDGYSLRGLLDDGRPMALVRKIDIVRQLCEGLRHCHQHGVIHRDLRPDNIIVPHTGPVKLVNFDCARVEKSDMQTIATRIGRHLDERYIAPEVWQNASAASPASDIYAAGIILFELLTGESPYQKIDSLFANERLPRLPSEVNPQLPNDVDEMVSLMCAFKPKERLSSIDELLEYLDSMSL
jgi:serine/threonine protein kinase